MSPRGSFSFSGGRASPYAPLSHNDRHLSDMYEYVPGDDYRQYSNRYEGAIDDQEEPDVINVRYLNSTFKAEFPAFSISESRVFVSDLRRKVSRKLNEDPRTIRLVYKDRDLRNDARSLKFYGCKQNSEVAVVVTENLNDYGNVDSHSSEDDSRRPPADIDRRRSRAGSSVRDRQTYQEEYGRPPRSSNFLHPEEHQRPARSQRRSPSPARPSPTPVRVTREPSPATSQPSATSIPPSPRRPSRPAADPKSAMGQIQSLQAKFFDVHRPAAYRFLDSPPSDPSVLQNTYNQVVENLMKHIEAADAITMGEDVDARAERKSLVTEVQKLLNEVDAKYHQHTR